MKIVAWIAVSGSAFVVILMPFLFGKARDPYNYASWIGETIQAALVIALAGRVLGWW